MVPGRVRSEAIERVGVGVCAIEDRASRRGMALPNGEGTAVVGNVNVVVGEAGSASVRRPTPRHAEGGRTLCGQDEDRADRRIGDNRIGRRDINQRVSIRSRIGVVIEEMQLVLVNRWLSQADEGAVGDVKVLREEVAPVAVLHSEEPGRLPAGR